MFTSQPITPNTQYSEYHSITQTNRHKILTARSTYHEIQQKHNEPTINIIHRLAVPPRRQAARDRTQNLGWI